MEIFPDSVDEAYWKLNRCLAFNAELQFYSRVNSAKGRALYQ